MQNGQWIYRAKSLSASRAGAGNDDASGATPVTELIPAPGGMLIGTQSHAPRNPHGRGGMAGA